MSPSSNEASGELLQPFEVVALNLPEHQDNPIHTDAGAIAQGFPSALVAGVTVYAYLTHSPAAAWGLPWLVGGSAEVRFKTPVLADIDLRCTPRIDVNGSYIDAQSSGATNAVCQVWPHGVDQPKLRDGEALQPLDVELDDTWALYGQRCGDSLDIYDKHGLAHPSVWPNLANRMTHNQVVDGSWIHTRSRITHLGPAYRGARVRAEAVVVKRFDSRSGERAILDVVFSTDDGPVAYLEHEALVRLHRS